VWLDPEVFAQAIHEKGAPLTGVLWMGHLDR